MGSKRAKSPKLTDLDLLALVREGLIVDDLIDGCGCDICRAWQALSELERRLNSRG